MTDDTETGTNPDAPDRSAPAHAKPGRSRWWTAGAVVVAVAVVAAAGVAGVAYGRASAPGPDIVVQGEPVVEESSAAEPLPVGSLPTASSIIGAERPSLAVGPGSSSWPVLLSAGPGLSDDPTSATGYRLVNAGISGSQVAAVLAGTFGASGQPTQQDGAWVVGSPGGATLTVQDDPLFTWTYEDTSGLASPGAGQQIDPATSIELTNALLGSIGVDTTTVDWRVDRYADRTTVTAWQLIGEERSDLSWRIAFAPDGTVLEATGFSAGLEVVPGYEVVGAATAVKRSQVAPWSGLAPSPVRPPSPEQSGSEGSPSASPSSSPSPSPSPSPTANLPGPVVPVTGVTVTDATLGLAQYWQPDGGVLMLPSYLLTASDGSQWSLLAVEDDYVTFDERPYPSVGTAGR